MSLPLLPLPLQALPRFSAPARLIRAVDPRVPIGVKRRLVEPCSTGPSPSPSPRESSTP